MGKNAINLSHTESPSLCLLRYAKFPRVFHHPGHLRKTLKSTLEPPETLPTEPRSGPLKLPERLREVSAKEGLGLGFSGGPHPTSQGAATPRGTVREGTQAGAVTGWHQWPILPTTPISQEALRGSLRLPSSCAPTPCWRSCSSLGGDGKAKEGEADPLITHPRGSGFSTWHTVCIKWLLSD